jgi:hypothetical protein
MATSYSLNIPSTSGAVSSPAAALETASGSFKIVEPRMNCTDWQKVLKQKLILREKASTYSIKRHKRAHEVLMEDSKSALIRLRAKRRSERMLREIKAQVGEYAPSSDEEQSSDRDDDDCLIAAAPECPPLDDSEARSTMWTGDQDIDVYQAVHIQPIHCMKREYRRLQRMHADHACLQKPPNASVKRIRDETIPAPPPKRPYVHRVEKSSVSSPPPSVTACLTIDTDV